MSATDAAKAAARRAASRADNRRHRREDRKDRNSGLQDSFVHLIGKSEACSACGTVFDVRGLVLGEDGAICMDCDLEQQEDERYAGGRWDVTNLLAVLFLFLVSALGGAAALGEVHGAGYPLRDEAIITLATGLFGALSALATITSIRELPFDLPGRDAVVLTKRAATITLGWAAFAISVWAFITLLMV